MIIPTSYEIFLQSKITYLERLNIILKTKLEIYERADLNDEEKENRRRWCKIMEEGNDTYKP